MTNAHETQCKIERQKWRTVHIYEQKKTTDRNSVNKCQWITS